MALTERGDPTASTNGAHLGVAPVPTSSGDAPAADVTTVDWALGPGSVTWRVLDDPAVFLIGLLREAMLLTLHPHFAAAAFDHDSFGDDPVMRFRRIAMYTYGSTYGSKDDAERYSAIVRRRHDQIAGIEPITGLPYQANAEYENTLTQVMLADSFLAAYEALHGPLPGADRDQFVREQQIPAALLGVNPNHMPSTFGESVDFLAHARQRFATGLQARETLAPFSRGQYPVGSVIRELGLPKRVAAMFAARAFSDMAMSLMSPEERMLISIDRRPKLGSAWAVHQSYRALSAFLRGDKGRVLWDGFVHERVAAIIAVARAAESAHGSRNRRATFAVPDPMPLFVGLRDLDHNWPGSTEQYRLGRQPQA